MKINMGEVKRNQESLNASIKVMKSQLQSAQASLAKLANNKESVEGTAVGTALAGAPVVFGIVATVMIGSAISAGVKTLYKNVKPFKDVVDGAGDFLNETGNEIAKTTNTIGKYFSKSLDSMKGAFGW